MDPSAAPWRVLESDDARPASGGADRPDATPPSLAALLPVSPLTVAAVLGVVVMAVAAFAFAASDTWRRHPPCGRWR